MYDIVDEDTYVETVNDRLKNDWIVDDGTGNQLIASCDKLYPSYIRLLLI